MASAALPFALERNAQPVPAPERARLLADPGFGRVFTDHMAVVRYAEGKGWHEAKITARRPLTLDPAAAVLHYAQEVFEGLKAYRLADGKMALFRPDANARRFKVDVSAFPRLLLVEAACLAFPAFQQALPQNQPDFEP